MINFPMKKKYRETLIPGILALLIMAGILTFLIITGYLFALDIDEQIEATAEKSYVFKTHLKSNDIQIQSQDGVVTLTGTARNAAEKALIGQRIADIHGVIRIDNRMASE